MAGLACGGTIHEQMETGDGAGELRLKTGGRHPGRAFSHTRSGRRGRRKGKLKGLFSRSFCAVGA